MVKIDAYNDYADQYAEMVVGRETGKGMSDGIVPRLLEEIGDVSGLNVLDAGCGEGYLSRILFSLGARVIGIDIAPNLINIAREKDPEGKITYLAANLAEPLPEAYDGYKARFDLIASHLVMNDVYDYQGFIKTLATLTRPGGRLVFSMNNPYSLVVRSHVHDYFDTGKAHLYRGMSEEGVKVHFYHRTLAQYLDTLLAAGFQLQRLVDIPTPEGTFKRRSDTLIPPGYHFPFFIVLSLKKS